MRIRRTCKDRLRKQKTEKRDKGQEKSTEQRKATQGSPKHTEVSVVVVVEMDVVVDVAEVEVNVVVVVWKCPQT